MTDHFRSCSPARALSAFSRASILSLFALGLVLYRPASAQVVPNAPIKHMDLDAGGFVSEDADFGRCFGMGKFGPVGDNADDVVIAAPGEAVAGSSGPPVEGTGAAYPFPGPNLVQSPPIHILPPLDQIDHSVDEPLGLGVLAIKIGNVEGANHANRVFIAAAHVDRAENVVGAVNVYDLSSGTPGPAFVIEPPLDGAYVAAVVGGTIPADCPETPAGRFGHSFAIADVDGDGFNDLVVGASDSTEVSASNCTMRTAHGRVYIFFGHAHFFDQHYPGPGDAPGYLYRCIAIKAPQVDPSLPPEDWFIQGGQFGLSVDAADLDGDGKAEILAGRAEGKVTLDRGRAHLFRGSWIASMVPSVTGPLWPTAAAGKALVITPPVTMNKDVGVPEAYQTLVDPTDVGNTAFGFNVFMLRKDVGPAGATWPDGKPDIAIYSDKAKYFGPSVVFQAGALFVFFNNTGSALCTCPDCTLVCHDGVKLQTPTAAPYGGPSFYSRFGFVAKTITWASTLSGAPALADYLLVGEPNWDDDLVTPVRPDAGRAFMFALPIGPNDGAGALSPKVMLKSPLATQPKGLYGYWIDVGDYAIAGYPGEEFIVSERGKILPDPLGGPALRGAGRAYSYRGH